ncbi:MAG: hypothetical protein HYZ74_03060 [Elusimicrobia bacterium]|nr:hypothetical protein [Elusimicrobiota bacterium]
MRGGPLLAAFLAASAGASPFSPKIAEWADRGFALSQQASAEDGALSALAAVYTPKNSGGDRLELYVAIKDKAYLGYTHPSTVDRLTLEPSPDGRFTDLFGDGSRVLAYRATDSLRETQLSILRWRRFKIERVAVFPEGRFLRLGKEGSPVIAARSLPLGQQVQVSCRDFGTVSRTAFKTSLHAPRSGTFVDVSDRHPAYFESEIARKEKALTALKGSLEENAGEYLGLALSSYFDYAALGRARAGWERLRSFFAVPSYAPSSVKACMTAMEKDLRRWLKVPTNWP